MEEKKYSCPHDVYNEWFETIEKMCDEKYPGREDIKLANNGLIIHRENGNITFYNDSDKSERWEKTNENGGRITLVMGKNDVARISFGAEGTTATVLGKGRDYLFLPRNKNYADSAQDEYEEIGNLPSFDKEIEVLLDEACSEADDKEMEDMYRRGYELCCNVKEIVDIIREKDYPSNYDYYSKWIEAIEKKCDEEYPGQEDINLGYLKIKRENGETIISDDDNNSFVKTNTNGGRITIEIGKEGAKISYGAKGTTASAIGLGEDYAFLPTNQNYHLDSQDKNEIVGHNIGAHYYLLEDAQRDAEDEETLTMYKNAGAFMDTIGGLYQEAVLKYDWFLEEESTPNELEQMPVEELENMLRVTENENNQKRAELEALKRKKLIEEIRKAMEEGKKLDSKIAEAKINDLGNK